MITNKFIYHIIFPLYANISARTKQKRQKCILFYDNFFPVIHFKNIYYFQDKAQRIYTLHTYINALH